MSETESNNVRYRNLRYNFENVENMAKFIKEKKIEFLDACFADPLGMWQHCTYSASQCSAEDLKKGFAFDGSSIRLFCSVDTSDIIMKPDPTTCWIDPYQGDDTLHTTCSVYDVNGNEYERCPRTIAKNAVKYLKSTNIADTVFFGPEAEFFLFDDIKYKISSNKISVELDANAGPWNTDKVGSISNYCSSKNNLGNRMPAQRWYFPTPPIDSHSKLRSEMLSTMKQIGINTEKQHHEVASCQHELGYECMPLLECADALMCYKYVVKNTAEKYGLIATFMPKPLYGDNGSGMHCHQSLWKNNVNLFYNNDKNYENSSYMKLSKIAMYYIGGLLKHARSILAFTNPTTNSYKRLIPGYEAPVYLSYAKGNRSASIRIPLADSDNPKAKRIEFRCPDGASCPYIAFAAMLMAGIDGIKHEILPGDPLDCDIFKLSEEKKKNLISTPHSLDEALDALQEDHSYLTEGNVFSEEFINAYISFKRKEIDSCKYIPHPKEYELYFNC